METGPGSFTCKSQDKALALRPRLKILNCYFCYILLVKVGPKDSLNSGMARQVPPPDGGNRKAAFKRVVHRVVGGISGYFLQSTTVSFGKIILDLKYCKC